MYRSPKFFDWVGLFWRELRKNTTIRWIEVQKIRNRILKDLSAFWKDG
jgi:hypothetical protein